MIFFLIGLNVVIIGIIWMIVRSEGGGRQEGSGRPKPVLNLLFLMAILINVVLLLWFVGVYVFTSG